ncbi:hypothetical protein AB0L33_33675 [Streptomyces sp. NPDC052299]|uniref:hypothetical protein n=1 Tax=Streptomyces sp. NPDC052299 TaxID=3155054 RepID=UPI0034220C2B
MGTPQQLSARVVARVGESVRVKIDEFAIAHGRKPTVDEVMELVAQDPVLKALVPRLTMKNVVEAALHGRTLNPTIYVFKPSPSPAQAAPQQRAAERKLAVALRFLPAGEREHYQAEWSGEMQAMEPAAAAQFAANVLLHAPLSGMSLRFAKLFKRSAT